MNSRPTTGADRGVSIAITHGLTIGITAVLLSALLVGAGNLLEGQEQRATEEQLDEIGADLVAQIDALDSLNETGENVTATAEPKYPGQVAGGTWYVELSDEVLVPGAEYDHALNVTTDAIDRTVQYPVATGAALETDRQVRGESVELCLENGVISVEGC